MLWSLVAIAGIVAAWPVLCISLLLLCGRPNSHIARLAVLLCLSVCLFRTKTKSVEKQQNRFEHAPGAGATGMPIFS